MDKVGGHWPLWRGWKKRMTMQNRQKSNAKKTKIIHVAQYSDDNILKTNTMGLKVQLLHITV